MDRPSILRVLVFVLILSTLAAVALWYLYTFQINRTLPPPSFEESSGNSKNARLISNPETLVPPVSPDSLQKEIRERFLNIAANAVETDSVSINNECVVKPPIIRMKKEGDLVTIQNDSDRIRLISFDNDILLELVPGEKGEIKSSFFERGMGIYGYLCDNGREPVGLVFVE